MLSNGLHGSNGIPNDLVSDPNFLYKVKEGKKEIDVKIKWPGSESYEFPSNKSMQSIAVILKEFQAKMKEVFEANRNKAGFDPFSYIWMGGPVDGKGALQKIAYYLHVKQQGTTNPYMLVPLETRALIELAQSAVKYGLYPRHLPHSNKPKTDVEAVQVLRARPPIPLPVMRRYYTELVAEPAQIADIFPISKTTDYVTMLAKKGIAAFINETCETWEKFHPVKEKRPTVETAAVPNTKRVHLATEGEADKFTVSFQVDAGICTKLQQFSHALLAQLPTQEQQATLKQRLDGVEINSLLGAVLVDPTETAAPVTDTAAAKTRVTSLWRLLWQFENRATKEEERRRREREEALRRQKEEDERKRKEKEEEEERKRKQKEEEEERKKKSVTIGAAALLDDF